MRAYCLCIGYHGDKTSFLVLNHRFVVLLFFWLWRQDDGSRSFWSRLCVCYCGLLNFFWTVRENNKTEPPHDETNKMACAPSEDSDQPGHPPSRISVFAVHMKKAWVLSYPLSAQRRLWSDWADAQADLSLRWAHSHFVSFVMRRLKLLLHRLYTLILMSLIGGRHWRFLIQYTRELCGQLAKIWGVLNRHFTSPQPPKMIDALPRVWGNMDIYEGLNGVPLKSIISKI